MAAAGDRARLRGGWRRWSPWVRTAGGLAVLVAVVVTVGTDGVAAGLGAVTPLSAGAALLLGLIGTAAGAWRWRLIAHRLDLSLTARAALADYYRASLLNAVLPAGVLGDVYRAVGHGRRAGHLGRGVRAVVWERGVGQVVLVGVVGVGWLSSGAAQAGAQHGSALVAAVVAAAVVVAVGIGSVVIVAARRRAADARRAAGQAVTGGGRGRAVPGGAGVRAAARTGVGWAAVRAELVAVRGVLPAAVGLSVVVAGAFLALFVVAARTVGVDAPVAVLVPLLLAALLAMSLPISVGGWGPREAVAALAFTGAGLGADTGLATAVAYGTLALISTAPGAVLLLPRRRRPA